MEGVMPATTLAGLPVPAESAAPDVPADMLALATALDPRLNLLAADAADRDSKYSDAPAGTLVSTPDGWQWIRLTDLTWLTIHSVETTTAFAWSSNFADNGNSILIRRDSAKYFLFLGATYSGLDLTSGSDGFLTDTLICTLPSGWRPVNGHSVTFVFNAAPNFGGQGITYGSTGTVNMTDARPSSTLTSGTTVALSASWETI